MGLGLMTGAVIAFLILITAAFATTGESRNGTWWIDTEIGLTFGPFRSEQAALNYPNTLLGVVVDAPAFRHGWTVRQNEPA